MTVLGREKQTMRRSLGGLGRNMETDKLLGKGSSDISKKLSFQNICPNLKPEVKAEKVDCTGGEMRQHDWWKNLLSIFLALDLRDITRDTE